MLATHQAGHDRSVGASVPVELTQRAPKALAGLRSDGIGLPCQVFLFDSSAVFDALGPSLCHFRLAAGQGEGTEPGQGDGGITCQSR